MNMHKNELRNVIDFMAREKGLEKDVLFEAIKSSLESAARKSVREIANPIIEINPDSYQVTIFGEFVVVPDAKTLSKNEVHLSVALLVREDAKLGEIVLLEKTPNDFGRIAAQAAKQVIIQKLHDAEVNAVYTDYKDRTFQIITGVVRHYSKRNVVIDLGRGEAVLKQKEQVPNEEYHMGDRLKFYVIAVSKGTQSLEISVSRSHPGFIQKLFEIEVPEIADGTIEIKGIAREPGFRTKIAVFSKDPKIDCVGACVGMRGTRVKTIVQELNGEKIDIIPWSADLATYCRNSLNPAKLKNILIQEADKRLVVFVDQSQFSLSIGKRGHNARLTSKLLGWKIDIQVEGTDESLEKKPVKIEAPKETISKEREDHLNTPVGDIEGLSRKVKEAFLDADYKTLGELQKLELDELFTIPGVGKSTAGEIMEHIQTLLGDLKES